MIGVAVSGGADSIYLLHHLMERGVRVTALHVNHQLRGEESDADEQFVRALGVPVLVHAAPLQGGNLEQAAREARYGWFRQLIQQGIADQVALGHTRSDQAETVLFRFLRGAGSAGLAGIRPETTDGFLRPLLHLTREEIRESLRARGIAWREDSSNQEIRFARNRIRHELLPMLKRDWNPQIEPALAQMADWALAEEAYWEEEVQRLARTYLRREPPSVIVKLPGSLPLAARRRLIRHAIELVKGDLRQIDFGHIDAILHLRNGQVCIPALVAQKSFDQLRLNPSGLESKDFYLAVEPPGEAHGVQYDVQQGEAVYNDEKHQLDWNKLPGRLELRNWHPGDRYRRVGHTNEQSLKLLFQKARVPVWERHSWPILVCGKDIAWSRQFGAAASMARTEETRVVLRLRDLSNRNQ